MVRKYPIHSAGVHVVDLERCEVFRLHDGNFSDDKASDLIESRGGRSEVPADR